MKIFILDYISLANREKHIFRTKEGAESMKKVIFTKLLLSRNTLNELSDCVNLLTSGKFDEALSTFNSRSVSYAEFKIGEYDLPPDDETIKEAESLMSLLTVKEIIE